MKARIALTALSLLIGTDSIASDLRSIGRDLPESLQPQDSPSEIASWESIAMDGLSGNALKKTLSRPAVHQDHLSTRGRKEVEIYRNASPAVVLVVTNDQFGSGIYLGSRQILTNWHVVKSYKSVGVLFKPAKEGSRVDLSGVVRADVLQTDVVRDLALMRVAVVPQTIPPLKMGTEAEIEIGADVHAIGHPTGEAWTFTKGLISQVRPNYEWKTEGQTHRADVIQTQTPINPGNSGGPLISENGTLLGVNSFKASGEGLNFAVSVVDVNEFLKQTKPQKNKALDAKLTCKPTQLYKGRDSRNEGEVVQIDTNCDGKVDFYLSTLDDLSKPIRAYIDSNFDYKTDILVEDTQRDKRWDISFHDVDFDGNVDLVGYHPDGKILPSRFEKYASNN